MVEIGERIHVSERIAALKRAFLDAKPSVCTERAEIYTQVYRERSAEPVVAKRASALAEVLRRMTIRIEDGELIVGNHASGLRAAPIFPEYAVDWILAELDELDRRPGDAFFPSEAAKAKLREILPLWAGSTLIEKGTALMDPLLREIHDAGIIRAEGNLTSGDGHIAVNYAKVLRLGIGGLLDEARSLRARENEVTQGGLRTAHFYRAVTMTLEALSLFILRFAELAAAQAEELGRRPPAGAAGSSPARDERRRASELRRIAAVCRRIATERPESFHEALQLVYFIQLVLQIESNGHSVSLGRMDQYLGPFYEADLAAGRIEPAEAFELLQNTWLKLLAITKIRPWSHTRFSAGGPLYQNVTIGGTTREGRDAVNPLSYLILDSVGSLKVTQPNLTVRYHRGLAEEFMARCIEVIAAGFGMPALNSDEIIVPALEALGVEPADALDYSAIGCIEVAVPGKWGYRCTGMSFLNLMRVLNCALRDGYDRESGKRYCPGNGRLEDFRDFSELMAAWERQARFYTRASVAIDTAVDTALEENVPDILCSALVDDCLERGKTIKEGGAKYDWVSGLQVGVANLANALAAIRKLLFEEHRIGAAALMEALESDFAGPEGEKLRLLLVNHAPKYGNDDDEVDLLLRQAFGSIIDELDRHTNTRYGRGPIGGRYYAGTSSISANVPSGAAVGATADGRKAYRPLAEGSSPSSGTDRLGPTAVFKSVSKLPTAKITGGVLLNQKLSPAAIEGEANRRKLASIIRTFFDELHGWHVQYNIVSRETLRAAQERPEEYRDLVVRVAGYSAFFVTLARDTQDDIIARTEHSLR